MKKFAILFIICALAYACKSPQPLVQTIETVRVERETVRDTVLKFAPDSASVRALLECDSLNNVIVVELERERGARIAPEVRKQKTNGGGMVLQVDCKEDSLQAEIQIRDKYIEELKNDTKQVPVRVRNGYDKFTSWGFWILFLLLLLRVAWWFVKKYYLRV